MILRLSMSVGVSVNLIVRRVNKVVREGVVDSNC